MNTPTVPTEHNADAQEAAFGHNAGPVKQSDVAWTKGNSR